VTRCRRVGVLSSARRWRSAARVRAAPLLAELALELVVELDRADRVLVGELLEHLVDDPQYVGLLVPEVVAQRVQRGVGELELRRSQLEVVVELGLRTLLVFVAHARAFARVLAPLIVRRRAAATALFRRSFAP
jgi:hypothetical protein